jgi:hypothetical protein
MRKFRLSVGPFAFLMVALIYILLGIAIPTTTAQAQKSYEFTAIAFLGDPAPGGGTADAFGAWNTSLNDNGLSLPITNSTSPQMPNLLDIIYP